MKPRIELRHILCTHCLVALQRAYQKDNAQRDRASTSAEGTSITSSVAAARVMLCAMVEQASKLTLTSRAFHNDQLAPFYEQIAELTGSPKCCR
jgi:acetylornithine/succinyldiaminopimelate/putrescine aminotransferase